ncbi:MAG: peptidylprolyl isomerase, partial [Myxococcales bacterium]|nr:peptidylprolyl isomerase [Myxococcales bacterium]
TAPPPAPRVLHTGKRPDATYFFTWCTPSEGDTPGWCAVTSRLAHAHAELTPAHDLALRWETVPQRCDERRARPAQRWLRCTRAGAPVLLPPGRPPYAMVVLEAAIDDPSAESLAWSLLDSGSADVVRLGPLPDPGPGYEAFVRDELGRMPGPEFDAVPVDAQPSPATMLRRTIDGLVGRSPPTWGTFALAYTRYDFEAFGALAEPTPDAIDDYLATHAAPLEARYETERSRFTRLPAQVRAEVIEVADTDDARARLLQLRAEIVRGKRTFDATAREVSIHVSARAGGDFGWVDQDAGEATGLPAPVAAALAELTLDEVSP